jgi:hypothetical protein
VGPRAGLGAVEKRKFLPLPGIVLFRNFIKLNLSCRGCNELVHRPNKIKFSKQILVEDVKFSRPYEDCCPLGCDIV